MLLGAHLLRLALLTSFAPPTDDPSTSLTTSAERPAVDTRRDVLTLPEVLRGLDPTLPRLTAADAKVEGARASLKSAKGAFDPKLVASGRATPAGYYKSAELDIYADAPTPLWGIGFFAGYRLGRGAFPIYDAKRSTGQSGELRAGVSVPLWQDGPIDARRANIRKSRLDIDFEEAQRQAVLVDATRAATNAYWDWVAAGQRVEIEKALLELATRRDDALRSQASSGFLPPIEVVDNERLVLERQRRVVNAERDLQRAAFQLGLYRRTEQGEPDPPEPFELPSAFPEPTTPSHSTDAALIEALESRPELAALRLSARKVGIDVKLAKNQRSAAIDLRGMVSKDIGPPDVKLDDSLRPGIRPAEAQIGLIIEIPVALRKARGDLEKARAEMRRVEADARWLEDRIKVEVLSAEVALRAAYENVRIAHRTVAVSEQLASAERRRFEQGDSDILRVNLREISATDARVAEVDATLQYYKATADFTAALGRTY